jgi:hypothetical protein
MPRWWVREAKRRAKQGEEYSPREADIIAQWPEDWREYHTHGLECIVMSGRIRSALFTEDPGGRAEPILAAFARYDDKAPWIHFVAGRLLAGVGVEILLKGLYLKRGYSIRNPDDHRAQPLAALGEDARRFNPRVSASFGTLLRDHNLQLIEDPGAFKPLAIAKWWRDDAAHTAMNSSGDAGAHLLGLGMALRHLHRSLLEAADPGHVRRVEAILREGRPMLG